MNVKRYIDTYLDSDMYSVISGITKMRIGPLYKADKAFAAAVDSCMASFRSLESYVVKRVEDTSMPG